MEPVEKTVTIPLSPKKAIDAFIDNINNWWPKKYTWSQNALVEIRIDRNIGGLCTEIGPYGFRCDWGRVINLESDSISLKWQISPKREPIPDPDQASDLVVNFNKHQKSKTECTLLHHHFENHGKDAEEYRDMMDSEYGWDYILSCYQHYCETY